jgi:exopolyphosphatase
MDLTGLIDEAGSASSLVTSIILDHRHSHGPLPRSLGDLILSSIAIDTKGLEKARPVDHTAAEAIFRFSHSAEEEDFRGFMKQLGKDLKKDLDHLTVWQLIQ